MNDPKNIDRIFKEKFKEFEETPPTKSWNEIQNRLNNNTATNHYKKSNKTSSNLLYISVSCLLLSLTIGGLSLYLNETKSIDNKLFSKNSNNTFSQFKYEQVNKFELQKSLQQLKAKLNQQLKVRANATDENFIIKNNKTFSYNEPKLNSKNYNSYKKEEVSLDLIDNFKIENSDRSVTYFKNLNEANISKQEVSNSIVDESTGNELNEEEVIKISNAKNITSASILETSNGNRVLRINTNKASDLEREKFQRKIINKSLLNSVDSIKNNRIIIKVDSTQLTKDELKLINQVPKKDVKKSKSLKISARLAPTYFNMHEKSYLDAQFDANKKTESITLNYGIGIEIGLTNKIALRTGLNKLALENKTLDVAYATDNANNFQNLDISPLGKNFFLESNFANTSLLENKGALKQNITYLEIPLEIKYRIFSNKFNIDAITGVSGLFLTENAVYLTSNSLEAIIGELNTLNKINYSINLGLGASCSLTDQLDFIIEPMFKYQLNTAENLNQKPYTFGIYTGVNYNF